MDNNLEKISLLIVDDIPETRDNLRKLLYFESDIEIVGIASSGREAIEEARKLQPNIVLMDINMPDVDGITASEEISRAAPMCSIIMMSVQSEADYLRRSMLAGAMDFLTKPFTSEELVSSIRRVYEMGASRRASAPAASSPKAGEPAEEAGRDRKPAPGGKVLLIYSPKGGTGCSMVAANLAIGLSQVTTKKVALVDASLQFGDSGVLLNLQSKHTLADAIERVDTLDSELLSAILSPHASGIQALPAPSKPEMSETIEAEDMKELLNTMRKHFDLIVVDSGSYLDDIVLSLMDATDRILVVMTPEIPSIKSTKQFLEVAEALQFSLEQVDLVLNKALPRDGIRADQIEKSMKHEILAQLDFEPRIVRQSINQGLPFIVSEPNHPLAEKIVALAEQEAALLEPQEAPKVEQKEPAPPKEKRRRGLFSRLTG